jgi:dTDP-4-dehydrorhamnose 3,5-epimerase
MKFKELPLSGAHIITAEPFVDNRGMFERVLCMNLLKQVGHNKHIAQANHSMTKEKGAVRGMHYQVPPKAEIKIVRCIRGKVFDVIIDLRAGSPTFLQWYGAELSDDNMCMMYVPEGCAHGFQVLQAESELLYFHTAEYSPENEKAVRYDDPAIDIKWPLPVIDVSDRDRKHPLLSKDFAGIVL